MSTTPVDGNAETDSIFKAQKKFIWPVAVLAALAIGFFGGQQSRQSCVDAISKMDGAMMASQIKSDNPNPGGTDVIWDGASSSLLGEYNALADKCVN